MSTTSNAPTESAALRKTRAKKVDDAVDRPRPGDDQFGVLCSCARALDSSKSIRRGRRGARRTGDLAFWNLLEHLPEG